MTTQTQVPALRGDALTAEPLPAQLLSVRDLDITYLGEARRRPVHNVIENVSFDLEAGKILAVVGQSGSGKSTIARAVIGLLPQNGHITRGEVIIEGQAVTHLAHRQWRELHGTTTGFVPQDPLGSLDPLKRIGHQISEVLIVHGLAGRTQAKEVTLDLLDQVGIVNPRSRFRDYPHQLSGGQLQRVLIAIAIAGNPRLLIADEPTSALDVTVQQRILTLLSELQRDRGLGIVFITHDLALAEQHSDDVLVLQGGVTREQGSTTRVLRAPNHAYTRQLISDAPALSPDKYVRMRKPSVVAPNTTEPIVAVRDLVKSFRAGRSGEGPTKAVDGVAFEVAAGTTHALVGESGSGKTTTARILAGLSSFDDGKVRVAGSIRTADSEFGSSEQRDQAPLLQLVQQNPLAAIDPRYTIARAIAEPLQINKIGTRTDRRHRVIEALDRVGLPSILLNRRASEVSGGQRQRVVLARALALHPPVLVLDEPTSALDVTVQAQISDLLVELQQELGLTYLFISHDLGLVRQIADTVTVLEHGRQVESGDVRTVLENPSDPYTARLIAAVPGRHGRAA